MSEPILLELEGRTYAAGLVWLLPGGERRRRWTLTKAREVQASWYAEREQQTGFWTGDEPGEELGPVRSLAHEVAQSIDTEGQGTWQALLECGGERYAIVQGRGDEILANGDLLVEGREAALDAFAREGDWSVEYASAGLVEGARLLKLAAVETPCVLEAVPFGRAVVRRRLSAAAAVLVMLGVLGVAGRWAWQSYEEWSREEVVIGPTQVEEVIQEGVDVVAFLERCETAKRSAPALPPMWVSTYVACHSVGTEVEEVGAWLKEAEGVWFGRWRAQSGANAAAARQLAIKSFERWGSGTVLLATAFGGIAIEVPLKRWEGRQPSTVEFRHTVDRAVGTLGEVTYETGADGFVARLRTRYPIDVVRERLGPVRWLSLRSFAREGEEWKFEMVLVEPRTVIREVTQGTAS